MQVEWTFRDLLFANYVAIISSLFAGEFRDIVLVPLHYLRVFIYTQKQKQNQDIMESSHEQEQKSDKSWSQMGLRIARRRLPITSWIVDYTKRDLVSDLIAGITVGLTVVPQSMAYASIAGLSPEYGLYSSYLGALIYVVLGSCAQATIGPTSIMGLLTFQTCGAEYPACAILIGFYAGILELLFALLRLGWLVSFISEPVTIGFTAGASCTIIASQVKTLLGIKGSRGSGFLGYWTKIIQDFPTIQAADAIMGISSLVILLLLRKLKDVKHKNKVMKTTLWLTSLSRNMIVIVATSLIAYLWGQPLFKLVGHVVGGFPALSLPQFLLPYRNATDSLSFANETLAQGQGDFYDFKETWNFIKTGPFVIALISILQNVAISKAFGSGQKVDATQEMIALGTSNVLGGFISAIPTCAAFSRSAVNDASGVRSPLGGLFTGILVLLSLGFLTPSFYYIPKASLSAVIISAVMFMIDYESILPMWRISKMDCFSCILTMVTALLMGMEYGIGIGVLITVGDLLIKTLHPELQPEVIQDAKSGIQYVIICPQVSVTFPAIHHISSQIHKLSLKHKNCPVIVINFSKWSNYDYTAANTLMTLIKGMKKSGKTLVFTDCCPEWISVLKLAGLENPPCVNSGLELEEYLQKVLPSIVMDDVVISQEKQQRNEVTAMAVFDNASE